MSFLSKVRLRTAAWAIVIAFAMTSLNSPTFGQTPESDEKPESKQPAEKATDEKPTVSQPKDVVNPARLKAAQRAAAQRAKLKGDHEGHAHQAGAKPGQDVPEPTVTLKPGEVPGIKFDIDTYDFGRIQAGGDVIHDFWFTNTGNGALEILRVKPG